MISDGDCIAVFNSVHRVMKAEQILKQAKLDILVIPAPRELTADCGMAIRYRQDLREAVAVVLAGHDVEIVELWLKRVDDFSRLA